VRRIQIEVSWLSADFIRMVLMWPVKFLSDSHRIAGWQRFWSRIRSGEQIILYYVVCELSGRYRGRGWKNSGVPGIYREVKEADR
jgi:hypothetical protein